MLLQLRLLSQSAASIRDEPLDCAVQAGQVSIQRTIGGKLDVAPVAHRCHHAPEEPGEDLVQVGLDDLVLRLHRIDVGTEGKARRHVHRVAHEVRLQVNGPARLGGAAPSRQQPTADLRERREERLDVRGVQACENHRALALPRFSVGRKQALEAKFLRSLTRALRALEALGPIAEDGTDRLGVGEDDELA